MYEKEQEHGQKFGIDIEAHIKLFHDFKDDISNTVNYQNLYDDVKDIFFIKKYKLLESLGSVIAKNLIDKYNLKFCSVTVRKISVPIRGTLDSIEVQVIHND